MGVRSSNTNRNGPRSQSQNRLVNGQLQSYNNSEFNSGTKFSVAYSFEATGGTKTTNGAVVTHVFKTSGTLEVSGCPPSGVAIEYLVVGGGGAGIFYGSGGGAGGFRHNISGVPNAAPSYNLSNGTYTCTVGDGGEGQWPFVPATFYGVGQGNNSDFYPPGASFPDTSYIRGSGGGSGNTSKPTSTTYTQGGSGGGGTFNGGGAGPYPAGTGDKPDDPNHPQPQGNPGSTGYYGHPGPSSAGGGGGAGGAGSPSGTSASTCGTSGIGKVIPDAFLGGPTVAPTLGAPGPSPGRWFAGGGGSSGFDTFPQPASQGGGGGGDGTSYAGGGIGGSPPFTPAANRNGGANTGGGGGGCGNIGGYAAGGDGGSGIIVISYTKP